MDNFEVVLPTTTEEWQRDMNFAYNKALDDAIEFFMNHIHCNDNNPVVKNYVCGQLEKMKK